MYHVARAAVYGLQNNNDIVHTAFVAIHSFCSELQCPGSSRAASWKGWATQNAERGNRQNETVEK